ncbi:unnamed protein product [Zymoseptoria tritici ST99CH_3D7]|uniref:BZIP domain-containing protein n=2 Tax=Zymoseptoria tritici TaxID=1047171 RepID=A0A1X7RQY3_ZYMT9|nr:unnamed protein product [Zymoseptoria tritici ST99CH_3D7]
MNSDTMGHPAFDSKPHSQGYVSAGSDTRKSSSSGGKKRASRAGTRSVTTLSAAQLERKRANDREAQRAIRQRTKDHIDHLERSMNDLRGTQEAHEKIAHIAQQRNRELEDENAYLRSKLQEAGVPVNLPPPSEAQRQSEAVLLPLPSVSPLQRQSPHSTPSTHSMTTQSSNSRHGSWQHQVSGFGPNASAPMTMPGAVSVASAPNVTAWRSEHPMPDPMSATSSSSYAPNDRVEWPANGAPYQYVNQDPSRSQQYDSAPLPHHQGYQQAPVQHYANGSAQQQPYTQMGGQTEFPSISVSSSPTTYQVQAQPTFNQPPNFQVAPMQVPAGASEYSSPHGHMQPPPLPNASYPGHAEQQQQTYGAQQYRDETANRSYSLSQYPTA